MEKMTEDKVVVGGWEFTYDKYGNWINVEFKRAYAGEGDYEEQIQDQPASTVNMPEYRHESDEHCENRLANKPTIEKDQRRYKDGDQPEVQPHESISRNDSATGKDAWQYCLLCIEENALIKIACHNDHEASAAKQAIKRHISQMHGIVALYRYWKTHAENRAAVNDIWVCLPCVLGGKLASSNSPGVFGGTGCLMSHLKRSHKECHWAQHTVFPYDKYRAEMQKTMSRELKKERAERNITAAAGPSNCE
jgi:hypothetical protein